MSLWGRLKTWLRPRTRPAHLARGELGERAARRHLENDGLEFLVANYRSRRGEIDLVLRDDKTLVFAEVKTRSAGGWLRPAAAVNARKRRLITLTARDYLKHIGNPRLAIRFDIVEVLIHEGGRTEVRHLPNAFPMEAPHRYL